MAVQWGDKERRQFKSLCNVGCTREEVCAMMLVDSRELDQIVDANFRQDVGETTPVTFEKVARIFELQGHARLRMQQYQMATDGDKTMTIWLGKNLLGQTEQGKQVVEEKKTKVTPLAVIQGNRQKRAAGAENTA